MSICNLLLGLGQPNGVVAEVVHAVPLPQESISQDCEGSDGLGEVHRHEGADAGALNFEDIVVRGNGEVGTGQGEGKVWKGVSLVAFDCVLSIEGLLGTDFLVTKKC